MGINWCHGGSDLDADTYRKLQKADWVALGNEMVAFAIWRARMYRWRTGSSRDLTGATTAEDVVQTVITKAISGQRHWDPARGPLRPWLIDQVKSEIDALAKSAANRREVGLDDEDSEDENGGARVVEARVRAEAATSTPEAELLAKEDAREVARGVRAAFEALDGDPELEELLFAMMDGCEPRPRFLAEALGTSVREIENRAKRLKRRVQRAERIRNG